MKFLEIFLFLFHSQFLLAQEPYAINYSISEGFPSSTAYHVHQDKNGFLWFSTDVGIVKYDSHTFELINADKGLSDNEVFQLKTDSKGRTWALTLTGKLSFFYKNKIYTEANSNLVKKASGTSITVDFHEDLKKNIYITFRNGEVSMITPQDKVIKFFSKHLSLAGLWAKDNSLFIINSEFITNYYTRKRIFTFPKLKYNNIHHTQNGNYLSISNVLYKIDTKNNFIKIVELLPNYEILKCVSENENKIWICTRNGLFLYQNGKITDHYFKDISISSIIKDFEGSYWITTHKNGIYHVPSFSIKTNTLGNPNGVKLNCIEINNKKEIWLGGENNDYYIKKYDSPTFSKEILFENSRKDKIPNIRFFNEDAYVIGKLNVKKISPDGKYQNLGFSANDILINGNQTYIGYTYTYNIPTSEITNLTPGYVNHQLFIDKRSNVFCKGSNDSFWIGSNNGLYSYSKKDSIINWGAKYKTLDSTIEDIYFDNSNNTTFVATASKGIVIIKDNKATYFITNKSGLNSNTCNSIQKISSNFYLIGTNSGLNSLSLKNNTFDVKNINTILGLQNIKVLDLSFLDNKVYLATESGLLYFDYSQIKNIKNKPLCHILELKNNSQIINNNSVINYNNRDVNILFNGISYINKGNLFYYYKLNNEEWTSSSESKINFKSLASGKYTFKVYCVDVNGMKSNIQQINFEIASPFWQKWWFIALSLIAIGLCIYFFIKYRLQLQEKRFEEEKSKIQVEKQLIELEQKALRMQMNPHFIFNALNTIKGYYTEGNLVEASTYISKFSKLLRKLLESEEQITTLDNEIEMLKLYIELTQIRYEGKFNYSIVISKDIQTSELLIPNLLLQPLVENSIIHGLGPKTEKGILQVVFNKDNEFLFCIVDDDGIGRAAALKNQSNKEHQSKAMDIIQERLLLFSSLSTIEYIDKKDLNDFSLGTKVIIKIPLKYKW